jgi:hypothetical protein
MHKMHKYGSSPAFCPSSQHHRRDFIADYAGFS